MSERDDELERWRARVGTTLLGKWRLEALLGVGGMAAVYAATHKMGRRDAVKILHPEIARSKELRARFEQEARAVTALGHPGAVEVRDIDTAEDGSPFLVMELLSGSSLAALAEQGALAPARLAALMDTTLDVLAAAHARGIIHRDIKPDNLFVTDAGALKVLDFGIARMRERDAGSLHTKTGAMLGTISYMSPEQILGRGVDGRADVFSVGATMFRVLAGRRIHEAETETEHLVKMGTQPAPALRTVAPHVEPGLAAVVDRALAFDVEARYPDVRTMQADLRAALRGEPPPFATARLGTLVATAAASSPRGSPTVVDGPMSSQSSPPSSAWPDLGPPPVVTVGSPGAVGSPVAAPPGASMRFSPASAPSATVSASSPTVLATTTAPEADERRRNRGLWLSLTVALVVLIAGTGWLIASASSSKRASSTSSEGATEDRDPDASGPGLEGLFSRGTASASAPVLVVPLPLPPMGSGPTTASSTSNPTSPTGPTGPTSPTSPAGQPATARPPPPSPHTMAPPPGGPPPKGKGKDKHKGKGKDWDDD